MEHICPHCKSEQTVTRNHGRKTFSALGTLSGALLAARSTKAGATLGSIAGPPGMLFGGLAGIVIAGISGGLLGGSAGAALGGMMDRNILDNHKCIACRRVFSSPHTSAELEYLQSSYVDDELEHPQLN